MHIVRFHLALHFPSHTPALPLHMVGKANSEDLKRCIGYEKRDVAFKEAMKEYCKEKASSKPKKEKKGLCHFASKFKVSLKGLWDWLKGEKSFLERNMEQQLLTLVEEDKIVELVVISLDWGDPLTQKEIKKVCK